MSTVGQAEGPQLAAGDVVIAARGIGKSFGHVRALHNVSFELRRGEVAAVFGDNGAGKSTLAKCLCGVQTPDHGYLEIDSQQVVLHSIRDAERYGITTAHQDLALAPDLTVLENMFLGRELLARGWRGRLGMLARTEMARKSEQALATLQIRLPTVRLQVASLSGGQKQAVAVARAAMWSRSGILLDEPTAALGTRQSDVVCELIRSTADRGLGVMVISHDIPRILAVADRVIVLFHGSVVLESAASAVTGRDIVDAMVGYHASTGELP
jgi:ABC-type sugar transport system ATPase subunit